MVSLEAYKRALGSRAAGMSEEQIKNLMDLQARLARVLFDMWGKHLRENSAQSDKQNEEKSSKIEV